MRWTALRTVDLPLPFSPVMMVAAESRRSEKVLAPKSPRTDIELRGQTKLG
jgi:hypothetical protein